MTIGIKELDGTFIATPDKSMTKTSAPKVLSVSFGDGYEQRIADGINSLRETYSLSFKTRPKADIEDIVVFLDTKKNVSKFLFTMPDTNNTTRTGEKDLKVVSTGYSLTYDYDNFYSLTLSLKRVFEA
jgi:phage-related protein|tara:strand:+ start:6783 stop:7166 length:384 start_codon:yes stop_codon:yes gene_type:complete